VSVVGDDAFGRQILADLDRLGVEWAGVEVVAGPTGLTVAAVRPDGERAFLSSFGSQARLDPDLLQRQAGRIEAAGVVCLVGQFCLPTLSTTAAATLLGRVRARGATTLLDTGWDPAGWPPASVDAVRDLLPTVDLFLPNADEARALSGEPDPAAAATKFRADGAGVVAVKLGADGSLAVAADGEHRAAALPVAALDAVGAGDTFDAGFLRALMLGHDVPQALALGNSAAGLYVSRAGDRWPTWDELVGAAGRD
jgi:sugar/nucleoside kinase (ribokinase family)